MPITVPSQQGWGRGWGDISERQPYRPSRFRSVDGKERLLQKGLFHGGSFPVAWELMACLMELPTPVLDGTCLNPSLLLGK